MIIPVRLATEIRNVNRWETCSSTDSHEEGRKDRVLCGLDAAAGGIKSEVESGPTALTFKD